MEFALDDFELSIRGAGPWLTSDLRTAIVKLRAHFCKLDVDELGFIYWINSLGFYQPIYAASNMSTTRLKLHFGYNDLKVGYE